MKALTSCEVDEVSGGEVGATRDAGVGYTGIYPSGVSCANAMMAYGGLGGSLGGLFGGLGGLLGSLGGAWYGTKLKVCAK